LFERALKTAVPIRALFLIKLCYYYIGKKFYNISAIFLRGFSAIELVRPFFLQKDKSFKKRALIGTAF